MSKYADPDDFTRCGLRLWGLRQAWVKCPTARLSSRATVATGVRPQSTEPPRSAHQVSRSSTANSAVTSRARVPSYPCEQPRLLT